MTEQTYIHGNVHEKTIESLSTKKDKENYSNYRNEFGLASKFKKIQKFPIHLDIEIDNFCNFACSFCPIGQPENKYHEQYKTLTRIDNDKIYNLLDECKIIGVKSVQFNLVNEPLANKNIFDYIKYANKIGIIDTTIVSNAYLLNEKNSLKILESGLKKIQFSLDAFSEETYKERKLKNLKPANYKKTITNILNFLEIKKKKKLNFPIVRVSFIQMEQNKHERIEFENFWKNKVDAIHFQKLIDFMNEDPNKIRKIDYKCNMPMFRMSVKANGDVKPCCTTYGEDINLGNIYSDSLSEIWNSDFMKNFQQLHIKGTANKNKACLECLNNTL